MTARIVYLMRGLPACGKSRFARRLAGAHGIVLETDQFFVTEGAGANPRYCYREALLPTARQWNFDRFQKAIEAGISPIVVDRGNGLNAATQQYAQYAIAHGYQVELREPDSPWWQEIRILLRDPRAHWQLLCQWADRLALLSQTTHRVPAATIKRWMAAWKSDLTVEEILTFRDPLRRAYSGAAMRP